MHQSPALGKVPKPPLAIIQMAYLRPYLGSERCDAGQVREPTPDKVASIMELVPG